LARIQRLGHLSKKPLSDNEIDDRLKAARAVLGEEHGATGPGDTSRPDLSVPTLSLGHDGDNLPWRACAFPLSALCN